MQALLANNEVILWWVSPWVVLHNIWLKANLFFRRLFHKGDLNITHLVSSKGAVRSAP
jgi:hypothetical protein